ncbi:glycosyl hydrolases family 31-domain-containing protein [Phakopsora pachyrhizi]|uniref:Glucosidase 2 subunit beta n=1 Tax=Phakopsora pachyrhizi TaxID=170000 RepID=A0AAV0AS48_PHAPC|nr:glycosyl hydrolases family 31-domain-containing protein [Phakopsora pachyrhizi]
MGPGSGLDCLRAATVFAFCLVLLVGPSYEVKRGDFKTCDQASFCKRNRERATRAASPEFSSEWRSPYRIKDSPVWLESENALQTVLVNDLYPKISFILHVAFVRGSEGTLRIKLDELKGLRQRFNEADRWTLWKNPELMSSGELSIKFDKTQTGVKWKGTFGHEYRFELRHDPLLITLLKDNHPHIVLNERGLLNMEHFRLKTNEADTKPEEGLNLQQTESDRIADSADRLYPGFKDANDDGLWEETFGGRTDSKPKGPESLSLDITFPGYSYVYGIPEHASPLSLKTTRGSSQPENKGSYTDPYRLWNLDVFEYEHDSEMALYGAVPLMKAHRTGSTVGVFWLNSAETWVDVEKEPTKLDVKRSWKPSTTLTSSSEAHDRDQGPSDTTTTTHWISEAGIMDLFIFLGPTSKEIFSSFGTLVGTNTVPPLFSIAYHQCRWNYVSQEDLLGVVHNFDKFDIPLDVIWLDIEYAEEHKYFIWNKKAFPEPLKMINELESTGRKLVTIVDPHIKRTTDLYVYKEAVDLGVLCKLPDGSEYEGWCWTGSSSWTDFFDPKSWDWWAGLFKFNKYRESTVNVHNWLVFNAPEITMPRDNIHFGGWEHRDLHNLNAMASHNQSARGLRERTDPPMRGLVLSRGFFAGTQRYGPIWQGDNMGTWDHLAVSIPMLLSNGIAGIAFNGADVGGFFGNPSHELLVRWYQIGAFYPFFRAHAHIDTKRREPYLFDEPIRSYIVDMIKLRYILLPSWYTAFFENTITGAPIAIPQYVMFPNDESGFAIDDQFYVGSSGLLVKPVTKEGATATDVYLADQQPYYNYFTHDVFKVDGSKGSSKRFSFNAPLNSVPLFIRGGHIFTRRDLVRRAAPLALKDPITLAVALSNDGSASGTLYLDDGESFNHDKGEFLYKSFSFKKDHGQSFTLSSSEAVSHALKNTNAALNSALKVHKSENGYTKKIAGVAIQKIIVLGLPKKPECVKVAGESEGLPFGFISGVSHDVDSAKKTGAGKSASRLEIKNANLKVVSDWSVQFNLGQSCPTGKEVSSSSLEALESASCPKGYFQCKNDGHVPACIRISRVNDGICEPECCDGSDEAGNPDSTCPNRCEAAGALYRQKREKQLKKFKAGNRERQSFVDFGRKEQVRLKESVKTLQIELITLKAKERDAKAELERAERSSEAEVNKLKQTDLYQNIVKYQGAIESLDQKNEKLKKDLDQLNSILRDLKGGYNPNYQDMAVKGAVKGYEEWESTQIKDESPEGKSDQPQSNELSSFEVKEMVKEDPVGLITGALEKLGHGSGDSHTIHSCEVKLESYLPDSLKSSYEAVREFLADALEKVGVSLEKSSAGDTARAHVVKAKAAHQDAENAVTDAQTKIEESNSNLSKDWGSEWEFKKLDQTCLQMNHDEYIYEVCLFGEAFQKSSNGFRTSLGRFAHWNEDAAKGSPEYYSKQLYLNGDKCWNGPERSARVDIKCGEKNSLYSVMEPEKCEYRFKMTSPAVCRDGLDKASENGEDEQWVVIHDEL